MFVFIDTAVRGCNVALGDENGVIAAHQEPIERGHAEQIIPIFEKLLVDSEGQPGDIKKVYVTVGPGSFTGLRVGLTTARFIGFSLGAPVKGITSFQSFSCGVSDDKNRVVLVETKRDDYYVQVLDGNHKAVTEPQCISSNDIQNFVVNHPDTIITGDAVTRFGGENGVQQNMINLDTVVKALSANQLQTIEPDAFYIRDADVSVPK